VLQVARQLFEPLTMQVIHWFSGNKKSESEETTTLLDAIYVSFLRAIINSRDARGLPVNQLTYRTIG